MIRLEETTSMHLEILCLGISRYDNSELYLDSTSE